MWSETRFAAHAHAVFNSFLDNIEFMLDALHRRQDEDKVTGDLEQAISLLRGKHIPCWYYGITLALFFIRLSRKIAFQCTFVRYV